MHFKRTASKRNSAVGKIRALTRVAPGDVTRSRSCPGLESQTGDNGHVMLRVRASEMTSRFRQIMRFHYWAIIEREGWTTPRYRLIRRHVDRWRSAPGGKCISIISVIGFADVQCRIVIIIIIILLIFFLYTVCLISSPLGTEYQAQ